MCIKHVQFFACPSKDGRAKHHCIKSNILCSEHFPCPEPQWERRTSEYRYMCPSCSGEPPEVPRQRPATEHWERDNSTDDDWVQCYVDGLCNSVLVWGWGRQHGRGSGLEDTVSVRQMTQLYPSFFLEWRCKERDHRPSQCTCEANGPLAYLYNPAMAARRHFTNETASEFATNSHVQGELARQSFADVHRRLSRMCSRGKLYFEDGIARQPFFSGEGVARRRSTLERVVKNAWRAMEDELTASADANGEGWTDAHTLMEERTRRRMSLVKFMGEIALYDNGFSMARFCLVAERLASIIQTPQWRGPSHVMSLEKMADVASAVQDGGNQPDSLNPFGEFTKKAVAYFTSKRETWAKEIRNYTSKRMLFDSAIEPMNDAALQAAVKDGVEEECAVCYVKFWETPSLRPPTPKQTPTAASPEQRDTLAGRQQLLVSQASTATTGSHISNQIRRLKWDDDPDVQRRIFGANAAGVSMFDRGEPPVRLKHCGHVIGRSCLFRAWVTEANDPDERPSCPFCRAEPPMGVYQVVEAFLGDGGRSWRFPTRLLSLLSR
ncbi:hypothetical protein CkaCkLH20_00515 [Colletotrichum karsti]|uniref:RING-type domain-containing protein n=1 Tax=Colletotrichum karsti TaxID=1095194 RepID=A0A9P6LNF1_9PEZI|nr:uncharacterized protein CkaCkLH20_00515 [Colletotrichum karsti]KAF9882479.1 hypothetical protein CkaCkLH20_00515 [Colletotrichum karsti]